MTQDEVLNRFAINHYYDLFTRDDIRSAQKDIFGYYYINEYKHNLSKNKLRKLFGLSEVTYEMVPEEKINEILAIVKETHSQSFEKVLKIYKADYLVWDRNKNPDWEFLFFSYPSQQPG